MYSSGVGKTRIGFAEAGPPRPLPSASWDRVSGYVVSLAENPPIAPRAAKSDGRKIPQQRTYVQSFRRFVPGCVRKVTCPPRWGGPNSEVFCPTPRKEPF